MKLCAEIISVGTELLLGNIVNTDAQIISQKLAELGINLFYHTVVGDNSVRLADTFKKALKRSSVIIFTGGLGPTCDDITKKTVADVLDLDLIFHQEIKDDFSEYFKKSGRVMTANNDSQAMIPKGAVILKNDWGTAPGVMIEKDGGYIFMLPGPPFECRNMLEHRICPILEKLTKKTIRSRFVRIFGMGESHVESLLHDMMTESTNPTLAPYASFGEAFVRVTAAGADPDEAFRLTEPAVKEVKKRIGSFVYGVDCASIEEAAVNLLREHKLTFSCAESCTGGLLAERITSIPGASDIFPGGLVSYAEEVKSRILGTEPEILSKYGVVSAQTASSMALHAAELFHTDIGAGITGYAGPSAPEGENTGHVFAAVSFGGRIEVREFNIPGDRIKVRRMASSHVLKMVIDLVQAR